MVYSVYLQAVYGQWMTSRGFSPRLDSDLGRASSIEPAARTLFFSCTYGQSLKGLADYGFTGVLRIFAERKLVAFWLKGSCLQIIESRVKLLVHECKGTSVEGYALCSNEPERLARFIACTLGSLHRSLRPADVMHRSLAFQAAHCLSCEMGLLTGQTAAYPHLIC